MLMRRQLLLPDYRRGHPFRDTIEAVAARPAPVSEQDSDLKLFVLAFTAFFVCFYTFIA